jgi:hypothetical protein
LPREVWPPEQTHAAGYPYAGSPYAGSPSPPVTRAWGNGHTDGYGRVNGRPPGPGYPPAGGRVAFGYPNGPGHPGYPPDGGHAYAGPYADAYAGPYADAYAGPYEDGYSGPYADAYSGGYAGPGVLNRPPGPHPDPRRPGVSRHPGIRCLSGRTRACRSR